MTITYREKILELKKGLTRIAAESEKYLNRPEEALFHENIVNEIKGLAALAENAAAELHFLPPALKEMISVEAEIVEERG